MVKKRARSTPTQSPQGGSSQDDQELVETPEELSMFDDLSSRLDVLVGEIRSLRGDTNALGVRVRDNEARFGAATGPPVAGALPQPPVASVVMVGSSSSSVATTSSSVATTPIPTTPISQVQYVIPRETVPIFKAETPASQPLKRNQEVERWLLAIENSVPGQPLSDKAFIQSARTTCRGAAEVLINSPLFESICTWDAFKAQIREKFRGTGSSSEFHRTLASLRLGKDQAPQDFYVEVEGCVYQGLRDYPGSIGDPVDTVKRVFMEGLPAWLRDILLLREDDNLRAIVAAAQRLWSNKSSGVQQPRSYPQSVQSRGVQQYGSYQQSGQARSGSQHTWFTGREGPVQQGGPRKYCRYHESTAHDTSECRVGQVVCRVCNQPGHIARNCRFQSAQGSQEGPAYSGEMYPEAQSGQQPCTGEYR